MLDHTKTYVEKIHYKDTELPGHKLDVKMQSLCVSGFSLFTVRVPAKSYHYGMNRPTTLCENKNGYISLLSNWNVIIGITSYYCAILKMVILHDAIKTIQNGVFVFF